MLGGDSGGPAGDGPGVCATIPGFSYVSAADGKSALVCGVSRLCRLI